MDVSAVGDEDLCRSAIGPRVAAAAGRTSHGDGVERRRSCNGVLIDVGAAVQE
jgi:hypothetical protein